jgi:hypothetical protein
MALSLNAGEYKLYTDVLINNPLVTGVQEEIIRRLKIYPNPVGETLRIESEKEPISKVALRTLQGVSLNPSRLSDQEWDVSSFAAGLYIAEIKTSKQTYRIKIVKH